MIVAVVGAKLVSYLPMVLLTVSLLIGVPLAYRYYRDLREDDDSLRGSDLLADLVQGDAASKMTEAEFRRVRELLSGAETGRSARTPAKPARAKPKAAAADLDLEEPLPGEYPERAEDASEDPPETEGTLHPFG